jgi:3-oxoacyl-[acyl-carrier-protein] synthase-3
MNYYIDKIEYYVPDKVISNDFLEEKCGLDIKFTEDKVGIKERRIAADDEYTSDLAFKAADKLLETHNIDRDKIGLILVCTQNPDYNLPTTACLVQDKLGLKKSTLAFDVNLGCSGFVYSSSIAGNFIKSGQVDHALVIMADEYSKIIDYNDKNTASIFGDAAAATLLKPCNDGEGFLDFEYGTDGSGARHLIAYNTGVVKQQDKDRKVFMDGLEIFKFAVKVIPPSVRSLAERNNITLDQVKYYIFHQANKYIIKEIQKRLKLKDEQVIIDLEMIGNTIQSTIPIALKNIIDSNKHKKGDMMIFSGYGVGLSWATCLYKCVF